MSNAQLISQLIVAIVAVLGFLLSCYSLYLHRRDRKADIRLAVDERREHDEEQGRHRFLDIQVANGGPIPLQIVAVYHGTKDAPKKVRVKDLDGDSPPPVMVEVGKSVRWTADYEELDRALRNLEEREQLMQGLQRIPDSPSELDESTSPGQRPQRSRLNIYLRYPLLILRRFLLLIISKSTGLHNFVFSNRYAFRLIYSTLQ